MGLVAWKLPGSGFGSYLILFRFSNYCFDFVYCYVDQILLKFISFRNLNSDFRFTFRPRIGSKDVGTLLKCWMRLALWTGQVRRICLTVSGTSHLVHVSWGLLSMRCWWVVRVCPILSRHRLTSTLLSFWYDDGQGPRSFLISLSLLCVVFVHWWAHFSRRLLFTIG